MTSRVPLQIVYLTFDDAFTAQAEDQFYRLLFNGTYKNPNGCNIRATHFLTQVCILPDTSSTSYQLPSNEKKKQAQSASQLLRVRT